MTMSDVSHLLDQRIALRFVQLVTGQDDSIIRVRILPDKDQPQPKGEASGTVAELWPSIVGAQARGLGVFWLPNLCGFQGDFAHDTDATGFLALFCDFDHGLPAEWHRNPDIIVHTREQHSHAYWCIAAGATADEWQHAQCRLIAHYKGADPVIKNPSRLMRLPGTLHLKGEANLVTFESMLDPDDRMLGMLPALSEVLKGIPDVRVAEKPKRADAEVPEDDPRNVAEGKRVITGFKPAKQGQHGDDHTFVLCAKLRRDLNLSVDTALLLLEPWNKQCSPPWDDDQLRTKLENAGRYGKNEPGSGTPKTAAEAFKGVDRSEVGASEERQHLSVPGNGPQHVGAAALVDNLPFPDVNRNTGALKATAANARVALVNVGLQCRHDVFHDKIIVGGQPLDRWVGAVNDEVVARLCHMTSEAFRFEPDPTKMSLAITQLAYENKFNPVTEYLDGLKWDGVERIDNWLIKHGGAPDTPFVRAVSRIVLVAAVRRARQPGCKFDEILVLESPEGFNKSGMIELMAGRENFSDQSILAADDRKQQEQMQGIWLYEIADLAGHGRAEVERVKAFASRKEDRCRPAYGRFIKQQPRQCVLIATTNDMDFLQSATGNRRWWPVRVSKHFDLAALAGVRDQLWAEAASQEAHGASIRLPRELWQTAGEEQEARRAKHPWEDILAGVCGEKHLVPGNADFHEERVLSTELFSKYLRLDPALQNSSNGKTVKQIMLRLGWQYRSGVRVGSRASGGYVRTVECPMPHAGKPRRELLGSAVEVLGAT